MKEKPFRNINRMASRRQFIQYSLQGIATTGFLGLAACRDDLRQAAGLEHNPEQAVEGGPTIEWVAATTWPPNFPILGEGVQLMARWIEQMSGGRLKIKVYGAGELIPALEVFDAVSNGSVQMGHGAAYYWGGKIPAANFFAAVPFGLNAQQMNTWLIGAGGWQLWQELYAPYNIIPFPAGNTGVQMGGWFNREIQRVEDLKGLKMRIPGLGGKVISQLGASAIQIPASEVYTSLERGVIDAAEWIGPYHDYQLGFHKIARYYYYPGWHEPGATLELLINKNAFESLPPSLQEIVRSAALSANLWILSTFEAKNAEYLARLLEEGRVIIRPYPEDVLQALQQATREVLEQLASQNQNSKNILHHLQLFKASITQWQKYGEFSMYRWLL